ncbi:hypothetical protein Tco_0986997, partial [Tanacetum coccineum]
MLLKGVAQLSGIQEVRWKLGAVSEAEQESRTEITYGGTSGSSSTGKLPVLGVKSFDRRSAHPSRHPSVGSS